MLKLPTGETDRRGGGTARSSLESSCSNAMRMRNQIDGEGSDNREGYTERGKDVNGGSSSRNDIRRSLSPRRRDGDKSPPREQVDFDISKVVRSNVRNPLDFDGDFLVPQTTLGQSRSLRSSLVNLGSQIKSDIGLPIYNIMSNIGGVRSSRNSGEVSRSSMESSRSGGSGLSERRHSQIGIKKLQNKAHNLVQSLAMNGDHTMYYGHRRMSRLEELNARRRMSRTGGRSVLAPAGPAGEPVLTPDLEEHLLQLSLRDGVHVDFSTCEDDLDHDPERLGRLSEFYGVDTIIENQRGWFFMGYPFFSDRSLFPLDPHGWTNREGRGLNGGIADYSLPDFTWEWLWKRWYVDMSGDVDDQGWKYSWRFRSRRWHGTHVWFRSFVRKRTWKRIRRKVDSLIPEVNSRISAPTSEVLIGDVLFHNPTDNQPRNNAPVTPIISLSVDPHSRDSWEIARPGSAEMPTIQESDSKVDSLINSMTNSRIDRERILKFTTFVLDPENIPSLKELQSRVNEIIESLQYRDSRGHLASRLKSYLPGDTPTITPNLHTDYIQSSAPTSSRTPSTSIAPPQAITDPEHIQSIQNLISFLESDLQGSPFFSTTRPSTSLSPSNSLLSSVPDKGKERATTLTGLKPPAAGLRPDP